MEEIMKHNYGKNNYRKNKLIMEEIMGHIMSKFVASSTNFCILVINSLYQPVIVYVSTRICECVLVSVVKISICNLQFSLYLY